jgi:hypothetical protein
MLQLAGFELLKLKTPKLKHALLLGLALVYNAAFGIT